MRFWLRCDRRSPRPGRAVRRFRAAGESFEVRSLLTSATVIRWSMVPQIAPDPAHGNEPDLPNTPAYVNPPDGYPYTCDGVDSVNLRASV